MAMTPIFFEQLLTFFVKLKKLCSPLFYRPSLNWHAKVLKAKCLVRLLLFCGRWSVVVAGSTHKVRFWSTTRDGTVCGWRLLAIGLLVQVNIVVVITGEQRHAWRVHVKSLFTFAPNTHTSTAAHTHPCPSDACTASVQSETFARESCSLVHHHDPCVRWSC